MHNTFELNLLHNMRIKQPSTIALSTKDHLSQKIEDR